MADHGPPIRKTWLLGHNELAPGFRVPIHGAFVTEELELWSLEHGETSHVEEFRRVYRERLARGGLSPRIEAAMRAWLARHEG